MCFMCQPCVKDTTILARSLYSCILTHVMFSIPILSPSQNHFVFLLYINMIMYVMYVNTKKCPFYIWCVLAIFASALDD